MPSFSRAWPLSVQALAQLPDFASPPALGALSFSLYKPGLPWGALTQIEGPGATQAALRLLGEHPHRKAAWVEERLEAYPPAFVQAGVNLACLLFVEGGGRFGWALAELLRSRVFQLVVVASPLDAGENAVELRRLQIHAREARCAVVIAAPIQGALWPLKLKLECRHEGGEPVLRQAGKKAWGGEP